MSGIVCPECGRAGIVIESRPAEYGTRRRLRCGLGHTFATMEMVTVRDTTRTVHVNRGGAITVATDGVALLRAKAVRAVEMAIR